MLTLRNPGFAKTFKYVLPPIVGCVVASWIAGIGPASASDEYVRSFTLAGRTIDRAHSMRWHNWTIGFGRGRPFGEFNDQGITLRGLSCANAKAVPIKCRLLMSMKPIESFPHFCEPSSDNLDAQGAWPVRIDCPTRIGFYR